MKRLAIFVSGSGTNAENIIVFFKKPENREIAQAAIVLSNKPDAYAITRAYNLQTPSYVFTKKMLEDGLVEKILELHRIDIVILAGFLLKIPEAMIRAYNGRIINIHPALLPSYGGKGMYGHHVHEAVIAAHEKESGITIHLVNEKYDDGKHLFQAKCSISENDTPDDLAAKIHELEQSHFPQVIRKYIVENF